MTSVRARIRCHAFEALLWWLVAFAVYFGDPRQFPVSISQGTEPVATVPLFNLWTLEWNVDRFTNGYAHYWDAPIFAPQSGTFAFSEPQPQLSLLAPLVWLTNSVIAYNVVFVTYLMLNGWLMRRLLTTLHVPLTWSIVGGLLLLLLPFISWQSGVLQLTAFWGPIAVIWRVVRLQQAPDGHRAVCLAMAYSAAYLACNYYGLFVTLLAPCFLVLLGRQLFDGKVWRSLVMAAGISGVLMGPIAWNQYRRLQLIDADRSLEMVSQLSATPTDYFVNRNVRVPLLDTKAWSDPLRGGWYLGSGSALLVSAMVGLIGGCLCRARRRWALFWLVLGSVALMASCGPPLRWGRLAPYHWLFTWYPALSTIRSPFRFAVFVQLSLVGLTVEGLWMLHRWGRTLFVPAAPSENAELVEDIAPAPAWQLGAGESLSLAFPVLAFGLILVQIWPNDLVLVRVPPRTPNASWIRWLDAETPPETTIVCLPLANGSTVHAYRDTINWMRHGLDHRRPLVNGYSGFFPSHFLQLRDQLNFAQQSEETAFTYSERLNHYPPVATLTWLRDQEIALVVVRRDLLPTLALESLNRFPVRHSDEEANVVIYDITEQQGGVAHAPSVEER